MVLRHFMLREQPFGVSPDPRYLYASATHREALASLLYGIDSGLGFVTLTANPGMGKTTLLFEVLRRKRETARTVFLFQTISTPVDLVRALLIDLGVKDTQRSLVEMQAQLNELLVNQAAAGKRLVVVIDEAQNLDESVLEAVRMLSNFETSRHKLMQIILSGQLQLAEKLGLPELLQLRQRISIFGHLKPLSTAETIAYVDHRLRVAGYDSAEPLFTESALALIARHSEGIPRNINTVCFNALSLGSALRAKAIDTDIVGEAIADRDVGSQEAMMAAPGQAVEKSGPAVSARRLARNEQSERRLFFPMAATCTKTSFFGGVAAQRHRGTCENGVVQANLRQTPAAPVNPLDAAPPSNAIAELQTRLVQAREGQSLYDICFENFGSCHPEILREIVRINPWLCDPDHIESGQSIALPFRPQDSTVCK